MSQCIWLQIILNYILSFVTKEIDKVSFRKYLLGLIWQNKYFSVRGISRNTKEKSMWQLYDFLESKINWKNLFYQLAKLIISMFKALNFYLAADGTPLKQPYQLIELDPSGHENFKQRIRGIFTLKIKIRFSLFHSLSLTISVKPATRAVILM